MKYPQVLDHTKPGEKIEQFQRRLSRLVVGQSDAVDQIVKMYQMYLTSLCAPSKPVASFLFLGPTGSGKTKTVEATAQAIYGKPTNIVKIDCAEFQHSHEIAKLIGSPPGYLGHRETSPLLAQENLDACHNQSDRITLVLFDEIEKASDALWNLLLGVLDKARLTLGNNMRVDFSRCMIFMTSNLGVTEMNALLGPKLGFQGAPGKVISPENHGLTAARKKFTPEFMNRLDKIVTFKALNEADLKRILALELMAVQSRIMNATREDSFAISVTNEAKTLLIEQGTDNKYGARHLKRAIERLVVHPLGNLLASKQIKGGDLIAIDKAIGLNEMIFSLISEGLTLATVFEDMADVAD